MAQTVTIDDALKVAAEYVRTRNWYSGILLCQRILDVQPGCAEAQAMLGICRFEWRYPLEGLGLVHKASLAAPGNAGIRVHLKELLERTVGFAEEHLEARRVQEAVAFCRAALAVDPTHPRAGAIVAAYDAPEPEGSEADGGFSYCIGITTFDKRFDDYFKPLLASIRAYSRSVPVIVTVNGNNAKPFNQRYRRELLEFCAGYDNVFPVFFPEFRSLAKMWNTIVVHSPKPYVLLLNDDISISGARALEETESLIRQHRTSFTINATFSHFVVSRDELDEIGYFDERFLGIGQEDGDFIWRYEAGLKRKLNNAKVDGYVNHISMIAQDHVERPAGSKISSFNLDFVNRKYVTDPSSPITGKFDAPKRAALTTEKPYPYERFFWENKEKL